MGGARKLANLPKYSAILDWLDGESFKKECGFTEGGKVKQRASIMRQKGRDLKPRMIGVMLYPICMSA